jgi:hypothetical protein
VSKLHRGISAAEGDDSALLVPGTDGNRVKQGPTAKQTPANTLDSGLILEFLQHGSAFASLVGLVLRS